MKISLQWRDLKPIHEVDHEAEDYEIYIWGFKFDEEFVPYYVGIAYNMTISKRLTEHVNNIISGRYCIIHQSNLKEFYNYKSWEEPKDEEGLLYIPNWPKGYTEFLKRRHFLRPHIDNMVDRMWFSFNSISDESLSKADYELIEKYCINSIGIERLWNYRSGHVEELKVTIKGDHRIVQLFSKK